MSGDTPTREPHTDGKIERLLVLGAPWAMAGTLLIAPFPLLLHLGSGAYLAVLLLLAAIGACVFAAEPRASRVMLCRVFALALFFRLVVLTVLAWVQLRLDGALMVGPDGAMFVQKSARLAARGFFFSPPNFAEWSTYDLGHFYLFAALMRWINADLFALQLFNCALLALSAGLIFSAVRLIEPRYAPAVGLLAALYPSSAAVAGYDLWKDPSVAFATAAFFWAAIRAWNADRPWAVAVFSVVAAAALAYLRCTRFYVVVHIEVGIVAVVMFAAARRISLKTRRTAAVFLTAAIVVAEAGPWGMGWPVSPVLLVKQIKFTLRSPRLRVAGSAGLFEGGRIPYTGSDPHFAFGGKDLVYVPPPLEPTADLLPPGGAIARIANTFRRVYGPFIWVLPSTVNPRLLFRSDYLLYPGMALWYASLPFILAGLWIVFWRTASGQEVNPALVALAVCLTTYFSQYFSINLSYRQRDIMFPFLMIFGCVGWGVLRLSWWRLMYRGYWALLCSIAVVHLIVRSTLNR